MFQKAKAQGKMEADKQKMFRYSKKQAVIFVQYFI